MAYVNMKNLSFILLLTLAVGSLFGIQETNAQERFFTPSHQRGASSMAKQNAKINQLNQKIQDLSDVAACTGAGEYMQVDSTVAGTTPYTWTCVTEVDPTVEAFAKTPITSLTAGACQASEVITFNGTELTCKAAGGAGSESDPTVKDWARQSSAITDATGSHPLETCPANNILTLSAGILECVVDMGSAGTGMGAGLGDLADVTLAAPANNDVLAFNGTIWVNQSEQDPTVETFAQNAVTGVTGTSCGVGKVLTLDTGILNCVTDVGGSGSALALDDLSDVATAGAVDTKILRHNGTNWVVSDETPETDPNVEPWGLTDVINGTDVSNCAAGQVLTLVADELSCVADTAGSSTFAYTDLTDTPADYTAATALDLVRLNAGKTALEFIDIASIETDPNVESWGKTVITNLTGGACPAGQLITFDGTQLTCATDAGASGVAFTDLTDSPANYVGHGSKLVRVNAGATGVEFTDLSAVETDPNVEPWGKTDVTGGTDASNCAAGEVLTLTADVLNCVPDTAGNGDFIDLGDTPANYTAAADKMLKVNAAGNAVEFTALSALETDPNVESWGKTAITNLTVGTCTGTEVLTFDGTQLTCKTDDTGISANIFEVTGGAGSEVISSVDANAPYATSDFVFGSPQLDDDGDGTHNSRMYFDKSKAAFRAGVASTSTRWNDANRGWYSIGMGRDVVASGLQSLALGFFTTASGIGSTSIGQEVTVTGDNSFGFGAGNSAGFGPIVSGANSVGFFMGDQDGVDVSTANTMAIMGGAVGISDTTPDGTLLLDVEGQIGATEYCDENGANCFTAAAAAATAIDDLTDAATDATSVFLGSTAGAVDDGANNNIGVGINALAVNTSGASNTAIGKDAMLANTIGFSNTVLGHGALDESISGESNTAIGYSALGASTGSNNTAIGRLAGNNLTSGADNIAIGDSTTFPSTTGSNQLNIGSTIYGDMTSGSEKISIGTSATTVGLHVATTDAILVPTGTTAERPTAVAGMIRYNSDDNLFEAYQAGSWDNLVGAQEINDLTDGIYDGSSVFLGNGSGANDDGANTNVGVGFDALATNISGIGNTAAGYRALQLSTGSGNTSFGTNALRVTTADNNTAFGSYALDEVTTGERNTSIGAGSLGLLVDGNTNIALGYRAGYTQTTGDNNIVIGRETGLPSATGSSQLNIGNTIYGNLAANRITIGASNSPSVTLDINGTDALIVARGTTAQRPSVPVNGMIRYNADTDRFEGYENGSWANVIADTAVLWENTAGVVRAASGTVAYATEDFVFGSPQLADDTNTDHDARMFFDKSKGAFRAGYVTGDQWDDANIGNNSIAFGGARATGTSSFAVGEDHSTNASGYSSVAMMSGVASGSYSLASGISVLSGGTYSVGLGGYVNASANYSAGLGLGVASGVRPSISGESSFGIFMGDQSGVDISTANTMAIMGGTVGIGTVTTSATLDVSGTLQLAGTGSEGCLADDVGTLRFVGGAMQVCIGD